MTKLEKLEILPIKKILEKNSRNNHYIKENKKESFLNDMSSTVKESLNTAAIGPKLVDKTIDKLSIFSVAFIPLMIGASAGVFVAGTAISTVRSTIRNGFNIIYSLNTTDDKNLSLESYTEFLA